MEDVKQDIIYIPIGSIDHGGDGARAAASHTTWIAIATQEQQTPLTNRVGQEKVDRRMSLRVCYGILQCPPLYNARYSVRSLDLKSERIVGHSTVGASP